MHAPIQMHGSMAALLGPNGLMVGRMAAAPTEAGR